MANNMPFYKMFPADWDFDLSEHPLKIEGAWIRVCNKLWRGKTRGRATKTIEQWAKILGVSESECERILRYIKNKEIGNVTFRNKNVTVICRRQLKEEKARQDTNKRVKRWRNAKSNTDVTEEKSEVILQKSDKEIKKKKYAEFVSLSKHEYQKLIDTYGQQTTKTLITTLDNYKGSSGKKYKSDYRAILNWVVDKVGAKEIVPTPEPDPVPELTSEQKEKAEIARKKAMAEMKELAESKRI